ncbi:MAG: sulfatase-like hydrolase/transferase [bacterium]
MIKGLIESVYKTYHFITLSFAITLTLLLCFFSLTGEIETIRAGIYLLSIPSYYWLLIVILTLLVVPLYKLPYVNYLIVGPKSLVDIVLLADFFVFKTYKTHIDPLFINMLIFDFKGFGFSSGFILFSISAFSAVIAINTWIYIKVKSDSYRLYYAAALIIGLFVLGQSLHIWANEYNKEDITKYTAYVPYYSPTTSSDTMGFLKKEFPRYFPKVSPLDPNKEIVIQEKSKELFTFPSRTLQFNQSKQKAPNIIVFVVESWRRDKVSKDITPHIAEFAKKSHHFTQHYSNGSVTASGLFSLMTGLSPNYWAYVKTDPLRYQSILVKSLKERGYQIEAYTSTNLDRFRLKSIFFADISDEHFKYKIHKTSIENDQYVLKKVIESIKQEPKDRPWFKFIFVAASHHPYSYTDSYKTFLPIPKNSEAFVFNKQLDARPFVNDYQNSLLFIDSLFAQCIRTLKKQGVYEDTLIILTSDHGEEFNDNGQGYWGHGSNFTKYQIGVPLMIKMPKQQQGQVHVKRTFHVDIVPTLMKHVLDVNNPFNEFSSGMDLFSRKGSRDAILKNYQEISYFIDDDIYTVKPRVESYSVHNIEDKNTQIDYKKLRNLKEKSEQFLN